MQNSNMTTRRSFIKNLSVTTLGSAALLSGCSSLTGRQSSNADSSMISKGDTVLFQGDSITDSGRARNQTSRGRSFGNPLGSGYVYFIAAQLMAQKPAYQLNILNRGISGDTVWMLDARWDADCIDLKPNLLSIMIGVNDIWHTLDGRYNSTKESYESGYRALLKKTVEALPDVRLVICEPYVLRCGSVNDSWFPEFDGYRAAAKKMSEEFNAAFVPFHTMFEKASKEVSPEYWAADGVHPTTAGAALMADEWLKVVAGSRRLPA